ncbi:fibrinogen-like protein A [Apostichopus japonicus]|uniref:fibrinogen-like protein A n=1 Tax=Stichopus japonicus TaxID=307972 RepID=UPI003AB5EFC0
MTDGGGWTVFQRRVNGSVDFYRNWTSYKEGFGELDGEFWLGNDKLHYLTNQGNYTLRIDLVDRNGSSYYAKYDLFRINDENDNYRLAELGTFTGTTGADGLRDHYKLQFSTNDRDNDDLSDLNCAMHKRGGWWYRRCCHSNLNGHYHATIKNASLSCCGLKKLCLLG